ncbi:MAG TPA: glycosyltransferase family 2 protein [Agriterribacter sp.]|nr:glycosyltransferase family 2 protein [Agriterribacter sp.]
MKKLSATVIVVNEEKKIGPCLQSLKRVADEIIVVDSLSTDNTKAVCLAHGVTFIEQPFLGYIEQKNFALGKTSHIHVLSLDADEALSDELIESILREKEKGFPADGYTMNRYNFYCGQWVRHGTYYPDRKLRLLDVNKGQWAGQNPHDKIIMQKGASIIHLIGDLLHHTYQSEEEHRHQQDRFSTIAAKAMYDQGIPSYSYKIWLNSIAAFIKGYVIKLGFLDGKAGFNIAWYTALHSYWKYKKLARLYREKQQPHAE